MAGEIPDCRRVDSVDPARMAKNILLKQERFFGLLVRGFVLI
jgi:hypothetical protein